MRGRFTVWVYQDIPTISRPHNFVPSMAHWQRKGIDRHKQRLFFSIVDRSPRKEVNQMQEEPTTREPQAAATASDTSEQLHTLRELAELTGRPLRTVQYNAHKLPEEVKRKDERGGILLTDTGAALLRSQIDTKKPPRNHRATTAQRATHCAQHCAAENQGNTSEIENSDRATAQHCAQDATYCAVHCAVNKSEDTQETPRNHETLRATTAQHCAQDSDLCAVLESSLQVLREQLSAQQKTIDGLTERLAAEQTAHAETRQALTAAQALHAGTLQRLADTQSQRTAEPEPQTTTATAEAVPEDEATDTQSDTQSAELRQTIERQAAELEQLREQLAAAQQPRGLFARLFHRGKEK